MIVGHTLGKDAFASVGSTASLIFLIIGFAQGVTNGLTIISAQRFGAGDLEGLKNLLSTDSSTLPSSAFY